MRAERVGGYRITPPGAPKDCQHHVVSLAGSGIAYKPGDALGVWPRNLDALVGAIVARLGATGDEPVTAGGQSLSFREALATKFDLTVISKRLLEACLTQGTEKFRALLEKGHEEHFRHYLTAWDDSHDVLDVLEEAPDARFSAAEFVTLLRPLAPRLYSIASSQALHPTEAHLLVLSVAYDVRGRAREGVASTFINDRWPQGTTAPVYTQDAQKHFGMPADPSTPMIMIGPGTGLAPFRGFLEERDAIGATGRNWLFFGDQARSWGYYYEPELTRVGEARFPAHRSGVLARPGLQDLRAAPDARAGARFLRMARRRRRDIHLRRQGKDGRRRPEGAAHHHRNARWADARSGYRVR